MTANPKSATNPLPVRVCYFTASYDIEMTAYDNEIFPYAESLRGGWFWSGKQLENLRQASRYSNKALSSPTGEGCKAIG